MRLTVHEAALIDRDELDTHDPHLSPQLFGDAARRACLEMAKLDSAALLTLDVGAGLIEASCAELALRHVTAVRLSKRQLQRARSPVAAEECVLRLAHPEALGLTSASFDRYVSIGAIEHVSDPQRALQEAFRVLKPGGRALIVGPLFRGQSWMRRLARHFMNVPSVGDYLRWFERAGFAELQTRVVEAPWRRGESYALAISGVKPLEATAILAPTSADVARNWASHVRAVWLRRIAGWMFRACAGVLAFWAQVTRDARPIAEPVQARIVEANASYTRTPSERDVLHIEALWSVCYPGRRRHGDVLADHPGWRQLKCFGLARDRPGLGPWIVADRAEPLTIGTYRELAELVGAGRTRLNQRLVAEVDLRGACLSAHGAGLVRPGITHVRKTDGTEELFPVDVLRSEFATPRVQHGPTGLSLKLTFEGLAVQAAGKALGASVARQFYAPGALGAYLADLLLGARVGVRGELELTLGKQSGQLIGHMIHNAFPDTFLAVRIHRNGQLLLDRVVARHICDDLDGYRKHIDRARLEITPVSFDLVCSPGIRKADGLSGQWKM